MIEIINTVVPSNDQWETIILGLRNPMNSWEKSDSHYCGKSCNGCGECEFPHSKSPNDVILGSNDLGLMKKLRNAGTDHRKFMRMIVVYADITAPLYWWKENDQYKVGTVTNSCSTMHCIHKKEFMIDDFSHEHLLDSDKQLLEYIIKYLNINRRSFIETKDKKYWWQMIQILPSSYNQKRTVMLNYEVLANIYKSRKDHKLDEWRDLCKWIETLPYSEIITGAGNDGN